MERRRAKRWIQKEEVLCYFEGARLGARSEDVSESGMFLATRKTVPLGGRVALIFQAQISHRNPIYLVGKVVRAQSRPIPGLGVQWVRAITDASPQQLSQFLRELLDVKVGGDIEEIASGPGEAVSLYTFPASRKRKAAPKKKSSVLELLDQLQVEEIPEPGSADPGPGKQTIQIKPPRATQAAKAPSAPAPASAPRPTRASAPPPSPAASSPATMRVDNRKVYAPCRIPGTMMIPGVQQEIVIRGLATWGLFVETGSRPRNGTEAGVIFDLHTKSGDARLTIRCEVEARKPAKDGWAAGLDLKVVDLGDPLGAALLKYYIRWLHFRSIEA